MKTRAIIILLSLYTTLHAAYLTNFPSTLKQPDGTLVDILLTGDEYHITPHDKDNHTIIQDEKTGYWCWAVQSGEGITSSGKPIHIYPAEITGTEWKGASPFPTQSNPDPPPTRTPTTGSIENIVVFIRFADETEFTATTTYYDDFFNASGQDVNSLYQYYYDASYHQLQVHSPLFPTPNQTAIQSYQSPHPRSYFQPYNAVTNPNGYTGGTSGTQRTNREHELITAAIAYISPNFPTTLNIDSDNDGRVDNMSFVIRGATEGWSELLWPHRSILYTSTVNLANKRVWDYNFHIESHIQYAGVGVLAHEFGHSLGAPDFYHNSQVGTPIGQWDLMSNNTTLPQSMSAYTKWRYMHWVDDLPIISSPGTYTLSPITSPADAIGYRIPSPYSATEYFVVEYRSNASGIIDSMLPGSGLLIYRVNRFANGNANGPPDELYVYRPNGSPTSDGDIAQAFFSAEVGRTSFNDLTNPSSFLSNGAFGGISIGLIGQPTETISFNVHHMNGISIVDLPYAQDFDSGISLGELGWNAEINEQSGIFAESGVDGTNALVISASEGSPTQEVRAPIMRVASSHVGLGFYYRLVNYPANWGGALTPTTLSEGDKVYVEVSSSAGGLGIYNVIHEINSTNHTTSTAFAELELPLTTYNNQTINIRFRVERAEGNWALVVDNFGVYIPPTPPPESLTATIDHYDVTLSWTPPLNPMHLLGYTLSRGTTPLITTPTTGLTFTDHDVVPGQHTYRLWAVYNIGESDPKTVQVTVNLQAPYTQDFNQATNLASIGWSGAAGILPLSGVGGSKAATISMNSNTIFRELFTPRLFGITEATLLTFAYRIVNSVANWSNPATATTLSIGDVVSISVSTTGVNGIYYGIHTIDNANHITSPNFATLEIPLTAYNNQGINICFLTYRTSGNWVLVLDDVKIFDHALFQPDKLTATVNENNVTLSWLPPQNATNLLGYTLHRYSTALIEAPTSALTYTDADLALGHYTYSVRAVYSEGVSTPLSTRIRIFDEVDVYFEDFNAGTSLADIGWGGNYNSISGIIANSGVNGSNGLAVNVYGGNNTGSVFSPLITTDYNERQLSFDYRIVNYTADFNGPLSPTVLADGDKVFIELLRYANPDVYTVAHEIGNANHRTSNAFATHEMPLTASDYQDVKVRFRPLRATGDWYFVVDNVVIRGVAAQLPPQYLTATPGDNSVLLNWQAPPSEALVGFHIYKNGVLLPVENQPHEVTFEDNQAVNGNTYAYYVAALYANGEEVATSQIVVVLLDEDSDLDEVLEPVTIGLYGNYPNPFNPETVISFSVAREGLVVIEVYNIKGQRVRSLVNGVHKAGVHSLVWNGRSDSGHSVGSGVYFYRMVCGEFTAVKKMLLIK